MLQIIVCYCLFNKRALHKMWVSKCNRAYLLAVTSIDITAEKKLSFTSLPSRFASKEDKNLQKSWMKNRPHILILTQSAGLSSAWKTHFTHITKLSQRVCFSIRVPPLQRFRVWKWITSRSLWFSGGSVFMQVWVKADGTARKVLIASATSVVIQKKYINFPVLWLINDDKQSSSLYRRCLFFFDSTELKTKKNNTTHYY